MNLDAFWKSEASLKLRHAAPLKNLLEAMSSEPSATYNLLFYGAFLHRIYAVMQREGKDAQGFARMQQSLAEAVEKIREALRIAENAGFLEARRYTEMSQEGMKTLLELSGDLAILKQWQIDNGLVDTEAGPRQTRNA